MAIIGTVSKHAKCNWNGDKITRPIFAAKLQKSPSSRGLCPLCDTLELQLFVQHGTKIRQFLCKKHLLLVQAPSLLGKPWLRFWSHSLLQADFSSDYMVQIRKERMNTAGLVFFFFQRWIQNCGFKISVFMCRSSVYFYSAHPIFG